MAKPDALKVAVKAFRAGAATPKRPRARSARRSAAPAGRTARADAADAPRLAPGGRQLARELLCTELVGALGARERQQLDEDMVARGAAAARARSRMRFGDFLPEIAPLVMTVMDAKAEVARAASDAAAPRRDGAERRDAQLVPAPRAVADPTTTEDCLDDLMDVTFVNSIDASASRSCSPSSRAASAGSGMLKMKACTCAGNVFSLVARPQDVLPFSDRLVEESRSAASTRVPRSRTTPSRRSRCSKDVGAARGAPAPTPWRGDLAEAR